MPALTIAALNMLDKDADTVMVVMPADHVIPNPAVFATAVAQAGRLADQDHPVTFGVMAILNTAMQSRAEVVSGRSSA